MPFGLAGKGEEYVVEVGGVDRQVVDLDGSEIESVEQGPQGGDATVTRHLQRECLVVPTGAIEGVGGEVELIARRGTAAARGRRARAA